ncbi:MAG: hypothetical protein IKT57_02920 [Clostridia bacterium]|nr:hypothetical protein [Clostridia bacterium]
MFEQKHIFVNAHINNISFPKTIKQLEEFIYEHGCYNVEDVLNEAADGYTIWTVPRSSVVGDVVLYFHAKTAIQWIRKLETATKTLNPELHDKALLLEWLQRARALYALYGGKIFAIGRVSSRPEREDDVEPIHWSGRVYADIKDLHLLETPVDISEFNSFILVSRQSAITPLPSNEFEKLKEIVHTKNPHIPEWFLESKIGNNMLSKVNQNNFLEITDLYRKRFPLEVNFRSYYVDYFLQTLSGKNVFRECQCHTQKTPLARVDNVFEFNGKTLLLEVKLNIALESDLISQLNQYICADSICLSTDQCKKITDFEKEFMFVIDVYAMYRYDVKHRKLVKLFDLDKIKSRDDIIRNMHNAMV